MCDQWLRLQMTTKAGRCRSDVRARGTMSRAQALVPKSLRQRVLVDLSVLHDEDEVSGRVGNQADVSDRVSVHEQQIGEGAFFDDAHLAGIRVALARHRQQLSV